MSILDTILGQVAGTPGQQTQQQYQQGQQQYQPGQVQQQQQHNLLESIAGLINHPQVGGIAGLAALFQKEGLGNIVAGWISKGPNPPVSADQVEQVFGSQQIGAIARKLGMDPTQASAHLAAVLPHAVDHLTPDGNVPQNPGTTQDMIAALKRKFLGT
jgi:uncharacterized protein YidB (DUF937 family)